MSDPLSFFAGEDSSSESEDEAEGEKNSKDDDDVSESNKDKLPSPNTLFKSVGRPAFLDDPLKGHIDWDKFVKSSDPEEGEPNVHQSDSYAAIPPPASLGPSGSPAPGSSKLTRSILGSGVVEFSSAPVEYSKNKNPTPGGPTTTGPDVAGVKRPQGSASVVLAAPEVESKKLKGDNFRRKEKKKRDLGQSSRGKSYVEEEKRVLRQQFATDEILS